MITLRYFSPADFVQLQQWVSSKRLLNEWSGALFSYPLSTEALDWYLEDANEPGVSDVFIYAAVDTDTGEVVGHVSLGSLSERDRSARVTRVLVGQNARRGLGIGTAMMREAVRIGFEELGLHRISLGVYDFNHAAIRCYQKVGFQIEGVLRDVVRHGDEFWSLVEMGILEDEWVELQAQEAVATGVLA